MKILSFESTCDETAVAVVEDGRKLLTDQIFSQADLHAVYGGVVPEIASRCHVESISILAQKAIEAAGITRQDIDAVAVSYAPGLIGAVLVGVNFAKSCALALNVPLIPVHHIRGHIAANYLAYPELEPPFLCLAISGGNTILVDVRGYTDMHILGATRDDAAGECFDKTARVLGLPYPGGKPIDLLSQGGDDTKYHFPISHVEGNPGRGDRPREPCGVVHEGCQRQSCTESHAGGKGAGARQDRRRGRSRCQFAHPRRFQGCGGEERTQALYSAAQALRG